MDADIKAAFDRVEATLAAIRSTQSQHTATLAQHTQSLSQLVSTTPRKGVMNRSEYLTRPIKIS